MTKVFRFNNYGNFPSVSLSTNEVINYAANGTIETIPANVFLSIIREYEERISDAEAESNLGGQGYDYDNGYDDGWESAVRDMKDHLKGM